MDTIDSIIAGPEPLGGELTPRERFLRTMHYQTVDRLPHMEFGYWDSLKERWQNEGYLPEDLPRNPVDETRSGGDALGSRGEIRNDAVEAWFGCEHRVGTGPRIGAGPLRPVEILEEREGKVIYRDGLGVLCEEVQEGIRTIPHFLEFPIKDRKSWANFRDEFLALDAEWRVQSEDRIEAQAREFRESAYPVGVNFGSFIGKIRDWVGFENLAYLSHDDPALLQEMVAHVTALKLKYLPPLLDRIAFDYASGWEDIAFNSGPLLSPRVFDQVIMPQMRPVMDLLRQHGIDIIFTDCDGNVNHLIPLWLDVGLNCMFPLEVRAHNDIVELRETYGRELLVIGSFDKFPLLEGKDAILAEFRRLEPVARDGGFIPHVDHRCPDGVPYENYLYYVREKCAFLGMSEEEVAEIPALRGAEL